MRGDNIKCNSLRKQWLDMIQNQKFIHMAVVEWLRKRFWEVGRFQMKESFLGDGLGVSILFKERYEAIECF